MEERVAFQMEKYLYIANDMRHRLLSGEFKIGDKLPAEKDLIIAYKVSKMTMKKALDILVDEGLIIKQRGSGTYVKMVTVRPVKKNSPIYRFNGMSATYPNQVVTSQLRFFTVEQVSHEVSQKLHIERESCVYHMYRVRQIDGETHVVERSYIPINLILGLNEAHLVGSLYRYIEEELHLKIQSAQRKISVRKATQEEAECLNVSQGDPVAVMEQIAFLDTGEAFEYSVSVYHADNYCLEMEVTKG